MPDPAVPVFAPKPELKPHLIEKVSQPGCIASMFFTCAASRNLRSAELHEANVAAGDRDELRSSFARNLL
jgi:hypothetical protein